MKLFKLSTRIIKIRWLINKTIMGTFGIKLCFIFGLGITSSLAGFLPLYNNAFRSNEKWSSLGNCFSGGVFIAVALIHLLNEGLENIQSAYSGDVPIGTFVLISGYILILFIEKVAFTNYHGHGTSLGEDKLEPKPDEGCQAGSILPRNSGCQGSGISLVCSDKEGLLASNSGTQNYLLEKPLDKPAGHSAATSVLLAVALTVHALLEGLAIGILGSFNKVLSIGLAVSLHKIPAAFALGISMKDLSRKKSCILMLNFILGSPIGIAIGMGLSQLGYPLLTGIFLCMCAGTFLYLSCSDVVVHEFSDSKNKYSKMGAFLFGCTLFACLNQVIQDET